MDNPRLIALSGGLQGKTFFLSEEETSIGRDTNCSIRVSGTSVSRRHCVIRKLGGEFHVQDQDSLNGTFVDGVPVRDVQLKHGNRIEVGKTQFLFLLQEEEYSEATKLLEMEEDLVPENTTFLKREDVVYTKRFSGTGESDPKKFSNWRTLLEISTSVPSFRTVDELQQNLKQQVFDVVPADQGAFLLTEGSLENPLVVYPWHRESSGKVAHVSRTVASEVLRQGSGLLSNDLSFREAFERAESLQSRQVHSVLCVPFMADQEPEGLIYLDSTNPAVRFEEEHLQFLSAVCGIVTVALSSIRYLEWLKEENRRLVAESDPGTDMIGESRVMNQVREFIRKVSQASATVLIAGESGTGKELVARAIHTNSERASGPFVAVNCAALTETLLESELFGHEKGSFTGAIAQKKGKLEVADGGTLFLDEVGELALPLQAKLLRVLQEREFERVGGTKPIRVDVRILAATNKDLKAAIESGAFRQDLYYRLDVLSMQMPALRDRKEDIPLLTNYFVSKHSARMKRRLKGITEKARQALIRYDWPGNIRELENAIERAIVLGTGDWLEPHDLPESVLENDVTGLSGISNYHEALVQMKKDLILKAWKQSGGKYTEAANILGVHANYLHRLIRNLHLKDQLK